MTDETLGYFGKKAAFNAAQGYRIDYKYLGMAYAIEIAVVSTSLLSAWFFAELYGHGDSTTMAMMMLAPIAYAGIEIARVPLALALRTQPNWFWKIVFALMVLCAVAVSVKSLSQLGEVMFRPRLIDVTHATTALKDAQSAQAIYAGRVGEADAVVAQRTRELADGEARLKGVNTELGALPADRCAQRVAHQPGGPALLGAGVPRRRAPGRHGDEPRGRAEGPGGRLRPRSTRPAPRARHSTPGRARSR